MSIFKIIKRGKLPLYFRILIETPFDNLEIDRIVEEVSGCAEEDVIIETYGDPFMGTGYDGNELLLYKELIEKVAAVCEGKRFKIGFDTELNFKPTRRFQVLRLMESLEDYKENIIFSAVFNFKEDRHQFYKMNELYLQKYITKVEIGLNKDTINFLKNKEEHYIDYLYNKYPFDFISFFATLGDTSHEERSKFFPKNEEELLEGYKNAYLRFPKAISFDRWKEVANDSGQEGRASCQGNQICFTKGGETYCNFCHNCPEVDSASKFLEQRGCLSCSYFKKCEIGCYYSETFSDIKKMEQCMWKELYIHLKE